MPGDQMLMSIGVVDLGFTSIFGVPGVVSLGVPGEVSIGVSDGSMLTVLCHNSLIPNHYP